MTRRCPPILTRTILPAVLALGAIGPAPTRADDPPPAAMAADAPITDEECRAVADAILAGFAAGDAEAIDRQIDWEALHRRATVGVDAPDEFRTGFLAGIEKARLAGRGFTNTVVESTKGGGDYSLLRWHTRDQRRRLLFRMLDADSKFNYHDYLLARQADGGVKVDDIYISMYGENLSESLRRVYAMAAVRVSRDKLTFLERLTGKDRTAAEYVKAVTAMNEARREGDNRRIVDLAKALPAAIRKDKGILLGRLMAAQQVDDDEYHRAMEEIRQSCPGDACIDMISIDYFLLKEQYPEALGCIDRVDRAVEGDTHLEHLRANVYLEMNDLVEARAAALRGLAGQPTLTTGHWTLISIALRQQDHAEVLRNLRTLRDRFEVEFDDLATVADYAQFVKSPEYQEWLKDPKPKPADEESRPAEGSKG